MMGPRKRRVIWQQVPVVKILLYCRAVLPAEFGLWTCDLVLGSALFLRLAVVKEESRRSQAREQRRGSEQVGRLVGRSGRLSKRGRRDRVVDVGDV